MRFQTVFDPGFTKSYSPENFQEGQTVKIYFFPSGNTVDVREGKVIDTQHRIRNDGRRKPMLELEVTREIRYKRKTRLGRKDVSLPREVDYIVPYYYHRIKFAEEI